MFCCKETLASVAALRPVLRPVQLSAGPIRRLATSAPSRLHPQAARWRVQDDVDEPLEEAVALASAAICSLVFATNNADADKGRAEGALYDLVEISTQHDDEWEFEWDFWPSNLWTDIHERRNAGGLFFLYPESGWDLPSRRRTMDIIDGLPARFSGVAVQEFVELIRKEGEVPRPVVDAVQAIRGQPAFLWFVFSLGAHLVAMKPAACDGDAAIIRLKMLVEEHKLFADYTLGGEGILNSMIDAARERVEHAKIYADFFPSDSEDDEEATMLLLMTTKLSHAQSYRGLTAMHSTHHTHAECRSKVGHPPRALLHSSLSRQAARLRSRHEG